MNTSKTSLKFVFWFLLAGIIFLRFWQLGQVPPGLNRDGASIGYTAYSLLKTGQDESGQTWPLAFKSFGDWKQPAYIYLTIPFVWLLGLNEKAVLLPSALAGLASLGLIYLLTRQLFKNKNVARWAVVFLAALPWHFHFSRYNHEVGLGFCFLLLATWLFLKKPRWRPLSAFFFGLTLYTYHGFLIFTPLLLLCLTIIYFNKLKSDRRQAIFSFLVLAVLGALIYKNAFSGARIKASISFLNDPVTIHSQIELPRLAQGNAWWAKIIYNRPVVFSRLFIQKYFLSFGPQFLATKGGNHPLHNFPGVANLFWWQYPLFGFGLYLLTKQKQKARWLILGWLIISPIASSLTKDAPNSGRVFPLILPLVICLALAANQIRRWQWLIIILFVLSLFKLYQNYFILMPRLRAVNWGAGYQPLATELNQKQNLPKKVLMSRPNYSPYIYFLFYQKFDPQAFQKTVVYYPTTEDGFSHVQSFDRYQFRDFTLADELKHDQLIVAWADNTSDEALKKYDPWLKKTISDQNGPRFYVFSGREE